MEQSGEHAGEYQESCANNHREDEKDGKKQQSSAAEIAPADVAITEGPDEVHDDIYDRNKQDQVSEDPLPSRQRLFSLVFRHGGHRAELPIATR
jgi:hypothetical protein